MRIGIISVQHESNTFLSTPTTLNLFRECQLLFGEPMQAACKDSNHEVSGFLAGLAEAGLDAVPVMSAWAMPAGTIAGDCCEALLRMLFDGLQQAGQLDGVLAAPHGAAVGAVRDFADFDGHWLARLRRAVGPDVPVIATIDPHANLSARMVDACDAVIAYRSNPHLDQKQRGLDAARLMQRTLAGEKRPTMAAAFPPVAINIERQLTEAEPCAGMYTLADRMLERPEVLSNSIVLGFPYADVAEMGSSFIVVTDNDPQLAQQLADELAAHVCTNRADFVGVFTGVEDAVEQALQGAGPVCLLDMGDNVGGGSAADGTFILHHLHERGDARAYVCLYDPESAALAAAAGAGGSVTLTMGGKTDALHGTALEAAVTVRSLHDGRFHDPQVRHGGRTDYNMGATAVVETATGITVCLTSQRTPPYSLVQISSCDLDPAAFDILVAKGVHAPVAAYREVCPTLIRVNTAGSTTADMRNLDYRNRRRPLFPFEEVLCRC